MQLSARHPDRPGFLPLYQQVRELLLARIANGAWRPAEALPSEQSLAAELGVSQGTVRKALDSLAAESVVERRQGKGTYVTQHTTESAQFRFFRLNYDGSNERALPTCKQASISKRKPPQDVRTALELAANEDVFCVGRTRYIDDQPMLREEIFVSADRMPNLDAHHPLPNTLYTFYQHHYDATIVSAAEQIKASPADKRVARELKIEVGAPVLFVERRAFGLKGAPIEFRRAIFNTEFTHYEVNLT
jgi:GntR family transcriptional regulator